MEKTCTKCGVMKSIDDFYPRRDGNRVGRRSDCKKCQNAKSAEWHSANPERSKELSKAWREANPDKVKANNAAWYAANRDRAKVTNKAWREANPDRVKANNAAWYAANKDRARTNGRLWYKANREHVYATLCDWRKANPEALRAQSSRRRHAAGAGLDSVDKLLATEYRKAIANDPCAYCGGPAAHDDHVIPLAKGGKDQWFNLVRACARDNMAKRDHDLEHFVDVILPELLVSDSASHA